VVKNDKDTKIIGVKMTEMKFYDWIVMGLLALGGINWGIVGFFDYNLLTLVPVAQVKYVYGALGLAGVYTAWVIYKRFKK